MKQLGKISGIAYAMIFFSGFYANFAVLERLIASSNPSITTANITHNQSQLGNGSLGSVVMLFFDLVFVWSLFGVTTLLDKTTSYIASSFSLIACLAFWSRFVQVRGNLSDHI